MNNLQNTLTMFASSSVFEASEFPAPQTHTENRADRCDKAGKTVDNKFMELEKYGTLK